MDVRSRLFPSVVELSGLNSTTGFTFNGERANDNSGYSVSAAGDVNGDGVDDFLIGAYLASPTPLLREAGKTYVVFGPINSEGGTFELAHLNGTKGFALIGEQANDQSGHSVASPGDVNNDGLNDILIGAFLADPTADRENAGKAYVVFGRTDLGSEGNLELSSLNSTTGFILNGEQTGDRAGISVSSAGDVNSDGITDFLIGASLADPTADREDAGKTYVVFGRSNLGSEGSFELSSLNGTTGFILNGEQANDHSGFSVAAAGDVNGDAVSDLLVGAFLASPAPGRENAGKAYVVFGRSRLGSGGTFDLSSLNSTTGVTLKGEQAGDQLGRAVSSAGDMNNDGIDDLLIGAHTAAPLPGREMAGKTYLVFGRNNLGSGGSPDLSGLPGTSGCTFYGENTNDGSGISVSAAGDVNSDNISDILIGAFHATPSLNRYWAGKTYVIFGRGGFCSEGTVDLLNLNSSTGFVLYGEKAKDRSGISTAAAGDINDDGIADFLIGADDAAPISGQKIAGKTYVIFGRRPPLSSTSGRLTKIAATSSISATLESTVHSRSRPVTTPDDTSSSLSLAVSLGIAGGICGLVSSIAASVLLFLRNRIPAHEPPNQNSKFTSLNPSSGDSHLKPENSSHYKDFPMRRTSDTHNSGSHYIGAKEFQELNRQFEQYDFIEATNDAQYVDMPRNQASD